MIILIAIRNYKILYGSRVMAIFAGFTFFTNCPRTHKAIIGHTSQVDLSTCLVSCNRDVLEPHIFKQNEDSFIQSWLLFELLPQRSFCAWNRQLK